MTQSEMEAERALIGVYDPNVDYTTTPSGLSTGLLPPTEAQWEAMVGTQVIIDSVTTTTLEGSGSNVSDLSQSVYFPPVGDQGSVGSCAAWSETYYAYGYLEAKDNDWTDASLGNPSHLFSPTWTYNLQNGGADEGSYRGDNTKVIRDIGAVTMDLSPYGADVTTWGSEAAWREAPLHRCQGFYNLAYDYSTEINAIKALIESGTPVNFGLNANCFSGTYADYNGNRNNIVSSSEYSATNTNHAQTIVGFNNSIYDNGEYGAFKVVNSWGTSFGIDGFYYITYQAFLEMAPYANVGYIVDYQDYQPSLLAVWHYDLAPTRDADIAVQAVERSTGRILAQVIPFIQAGSTNRMPTFMCLDISSLASYIDDTDIKFVLQIGSSDYPGQVSSFKIEQYEGQYQPGKASCISEQVSGLPVFTPCSIASMQHVQEPISISDALGWNDGAFSYAGDAQWVGVTSDGVTSMQSGDVGDGSGSYLVAFVEGPGSLAFDWKVSSESGYDYLNFSCDGQPIDSISGQQSWATIHYSVTSGTHYLVWGYTKDEGVSEGQDCGWVDNVQWGGRSSLAFDDFEGDQGFIWSSGDSNPDSGIDAWGPSTNGYFGGAHSAWCAQSGVGANGLPNYLNCYYDQNMDDYMMASMPSLTGLSGVRLSFYYYAYTGTSSLADYVYLRIYENNAWTTAWTQPSVNSNGWAVGNVTIPSGTDYIAFCFHSDSTVGLGPYPGVYIDDVLLTALDTQAPTSAIEALPIYTKGGSTTLALTAVDAGGSGIYDFQIYYRHGITGSFAPYTTPSNPSGIWTGTSVEFNIANTGGTEGMYQFYSIAIDNAGNTEAAPLSNDASTIFDAAPPVSTATASEPLSPTWNDHEVTVTLGASDAVSGVASTSYSLDGSSWSTYGIAILVQTEGSHTLEYRSTDMAGNVESMKSISFNIDLSAPQTTVVEINGTVGECGWYTSNVWVALQSQDALSGVDTIFYRINGGVWSDYRSAISLEVQGEYTLDYYAIDLAGNTEEMRTVSITVDDRTPVTIPSLSRDLGPSGYCNGTVTVNLTGTDDMSGVKEIRYRLNGLTWTTYSENLTFSHDGMYVLEFYAVDNAGNLEEMKAVSVGVDTNSPNTTAELEGMTGENDWYTSTVTIILSATDNSTGINWTMYRLDGGAWMDYDGTIFIPSDGIHTIDYYSTDNVSNAEPIRHLSVRIDKSAPAVSTKLVEGTTITTSSLELQWTSADEMSGVVSYAVSVDGGIFTSCDDPNMVLTGLSDGEHRIVVRTTDEAGNTASATIMLNVDTNPVSPSGPFGPWVLIGIIAIALAGVGTILLVRRRR